MQAELVSLSSKGKMRVFVGNDSTMTVYCDPTDDSTFLWNIVSIPPWGVMLSPQATYSGQTMYAAVYGGALPVTVDAGQTTSPSMPQVFDMQTHDLGILGFVDWNGYYLNVADTPGWFYPDAPSTGYALLSNTYDSASKDTLWFPKIVGGVSESVDLDHILKTFNITLTEEEYNRLLTQIS